MFVLQELDEGYLKPLFGGRQAGASFRGSYADLQLHGSEGNSPRRLQHQWQQQQHQQQQQGRQDGGSGGGGGGAPQQGGSVRQHSYQHEGQNVTEIQMEAPTERPDNAAGKNGSGGGGGANMI